MDNIDFLEFYLTEEEEALRIAMPIINAIKSFNTIRHNYFGVELLWPHLRAGEIS